MTAHSGFRLTALLACGANWVPAQEPTAAADTPRSFPELRRTIAGRSAAARRAAIDAFLRSCTSPHDVGTLRARLLSATDRLRRLELAAAAADFRTVLDDAPATARDAIARALYGLAQCEELAGNREESIALLRRLYAGFRDIRHARFAFAALSRFENPTPPAVGRPAPQFAVRDATGRAHTSANRFGRPVLIVFLAPGDRAAGARVARIIRRFREGGGGEQDVLLCTIGSGTAAFVERHHFRGPVIASARAFLEPVVLQFAVQALPDAFLIGPDGTLLLRSPRPREVERAMRLLAGR